MNKEKLPKERSVTPPQQGVSKGLTLLQSVATQGSCDPEKKMLRDHHNSLTKSVQALSQYYRKASQMKKLSSPHGFVSEMEELRKAFLMRPGCPQFATRATSVSHVGSATMVDLPRDTCVSSVAWRTTEEQPLDGLGSAISVDGYLLPLSKSACELYYTRKKSESPGTSPISSQAMVKRSKKTRMPWYISVIHEKDHNLFLLEEELQRLSKLETQMQKKDQEILSLQKEKEILKKQLKSLLKIKNAETSLGSVRMMQEDYNLAESSREMQMEPGSLVEEKSLEAPPEEAETTKPKGSLEKSGPLPEEAHEEQEEIKVAEEEEEEEEDEEEEEEDMEEEEDEELWELREEEDPHPKRAYSMTESFEEELMAQLEEYERMLMDFQNELELTRARYSLATGAITSLQRQTEFQESQLRKLTTENELLEKELRERKRQIQTMTDKFSSLREEKKHQEIMGLIEKENLILRKQVSSLETELMQRDQTIAELHTSTGELQAQVDLGEDHLKRWKELHDDLQARNETIRQTEQQTRVVLEASQARLERLRNKIIQAVYSVNGPKNLSTELSDNYILDSLQRIITERSDFYGQLKQKGVKVPPLQQSDISLPSKIKKVSPK